MDLYREDVMDQYEHPRNVGELTGEDVLREGANNASCGDRVEFFIRVAREKIVEIKWRGEGCAIMMASASKLSEYLQGQAPSAGSGLRLKDIKNMSEEELAKKAIGFEVNPGRAKCMMMSVKVVKKLCQSSN